MSSGLFGSSDDSSDEGGKSRGEPSEEKKPSKRPKLPGEDDRRFRQQETLFHEFFAGSQRNNNRKVESLQFYFHLLPDSQESEILSSLGVTAFLSKEDKKNYYYTAKFLGITEMESFGNKLKEISPAIATGFVKEWELTWICHCQIDSLPAAVERTWTQILACLEPVPKCCVGSFSVQMTHELNFLKRFLKDNHYLKEIKISARGRAYGISLAKNCLRNHPSLERVTFGLSQIDFLTCWNPWPEIGEALQAIATIPRLSDFNFSKAAHPRMDVPAVQASVVALLQNPSLRSFGGGPRMARWDEQACRELLAPALLQSNITRLDWRNVQWKAFYHVLNALAKRDSLQEWHLDIEDAMIGQSTVPNRDLDAFEQYMNQTQNLTELHIPTLYKKSHAFLSRLVNNTSLQSLHLENMVFEKDPNPEQDPAMNAIVHLIEHHPRLQKLSVETRANLWHILSEQVWSILERNNSSIQILHWFHVVQKDWRTRKYWEEVKGWTMVLRKNTRLQQLEMTPLSELDWDDESPDVEQLEELDEEQQKSAPYEEEIRGWLQANRECGTTRERLLRDPAAAEGRAETVALLSATADFVSCSYQVLSMEAPFLF